MKPKTRKSIFLVIIFLILVWYIYPELSLISKNIYINGINKHDADHKTIEFLNSNTLKTEFKVKDVSNIDLINSTITISGSSYLTDSSPELYFSLFDRITPLHKFNLNDGKVKIENNIIRISDDTLLTEGQTLLVEIYLDKYNGNDEYIPQIYSYSSGITELLISRYSYLVQYLVWIFAISGAIFSKSIWATVYDSKTKKPLSGVIVRVFSEKALVDTIITSITGILDIKLDKGEYTLQIIKPGYMFPSNLKPLKIDDQYQNLYYGGTIRVDKDNSKLKLNIPLDREIDGEVLSSNKAIDLALGTFSYFNAPLVAILAVSQVFVWPSYIESWFYAGIGGVLLLGRWLSTLRIVRNPGLIIDEQNHPLRNIEVTIFDSEWNKKIDSVITNEKGEYEFVLIPNNYYLTVKSSEYKLDIEKYNLPKKDNRGIMYVNENIKLVKK